MCASAWLASAVIAFMSVVVGAKINERATFRISREEEEKRSKQAARALLVEMYVNALRLRGAAQVIRQDKSADPPDYLHGHKYDEAYRVHLAAGIAGADWEDVEKIVQAYAYAATVIDGPLSIDARKRNPSESPVQNTSGVGFSKTYAQAAALFCDAIRRLEKRVPMNDNFNQALERVKSDVNEVLDLAGVPEYG